MKTESIFLFKDGTIFVGKPGNQASVLHTPMQMGRYPKTEKNVKNGSSSDGVYKEKIQIEQIMKFEHPSKLETQEQLDEFERNFPAMREASISSKTKRDDVQEKKKARLLFNPGRSEFLLPILPLIKKISGCEVNLQYHKASAKPFKKLGMHEKMVTFNFTCRLERTQILKV